MVQYCIYKFSKQNYILYVIHKAVPFLLKINITELYAEFIDPLPSLFLYIQIII